MIIMRQSKVLKALRKGEVATCTKVNLSDSRAVEIAAMNNFDCIWTDMEHGAIDWSQLEKQILATKVYDTDILVRVAKGCYSDYIRPYELDATGIMIPHVMNGNEAKEIVNITKFHPYGRRPVDGGNTDGAFCGIKLLDYMKQANEERFVIVQIEDYEAFERLEEIAAIEGIDMLFFGPADFSHSLGCPGDMNHKDVVKALETIPVIAKKYNKFAGTVANFENAQHLVDIGYRFLNIGADVIALNNYFQTVSKKFNELEL